MPFSPELAEIRFGCGLSPVIAPPATPLDMLNGLNAPDEMAARYPVTSFAQQRGWLVEVQKLRKEARKSKQRAKLDAQIKEIRRKAVQAGARSYTQTLMRWAYTNQGMRERMVAFWADHFTAMGKNAIFRYAAASYVEEAIRPNIAGRFGDLLVATTTHPLMLHFLDQSESVGPASRAASRNKRHKGLNENLAREVLELHTLGVGGPYTQGDVRQLAELFTGLSYSTKSGFKFRPAFSEPGAETVMGQSYGGNPGTLESVQQALRDLAVHPVTAGHIARKLAVHFVSDTPDRALIQHIEKRFLDTGGDLMAVYGALLEHPASWSLRLSNVKPAADFVASTARALAPDPGHIAKMKTKKIRRTLLAPMDLMGQPWQRPGGPDGWPEQDAAWITPQAVAARLRWALSAPRVLRPKLPDPRHFVAQALGSFAPQPVVFAASAAESKSDAIGLILASPAFQRR